MGWLRRTASGWAAVALLLLSPLGPASRVRAEPTPADRVTARALMEQGDARSDQSDQVGALKAYLAAHALMGVPTTGLAVARALAATGQLVEAHDMATQVARMGATPGEPRPFTVARAEAARLADDLSPRLGALIVSVPGSCAGVRVERVEIDGVPLPSAMLDLPWRVNPGRHTVRARAARCENDQQTVDVSPGQTLSVVLVLTPTPIARPRPPERPQTGSRVAPRPPPSGLAGGAPTQDGEHALAHARDAGVPVVSWPRRSLALWVAGGGAVALATASVLGLVARAKYDGVDTHCDAGGCDDVGFAARSTALREGDGATIAATVGAACLAVAMALWLTAPTGAPPIRAGVARSPALIQVTF
jgi:hypothetical protein